MFLERYELGELIAESERNTVRRARRLDDGRRVIIKTSTREYPSVRDLRKLAFEYHLLQKLAGPGVIEALGTERQSGRLALVLEDFGGERLPVRPNQGLALPTFFSLALGIVRALGQVHAKDVIHKDINPRNVLMNPSTREVKLIDFSLSSELSREQPELAAGARLEGTLPYISPEQTGRMNRDVDYRSDFYALGVTFFELLTGTQPFAAPDVLGYVHCHLSKPAPNARERNPAVPEGLARVVAKLMAKNPDERYQSARGLVADLEHCERTFRELRDVPPFGLAQQDVSERFDVSRELVGREAEVAELLSVFDAVSAGPAQLLLVAGYSGIGKSSLIREIHKPVIDKRANFVSGKFEQLERNTPYAALLEALREFLKQALTATEEQLLATKLRFASALGNNAGVLFPLLPELGQIMGQQAPVAELPAREAQGRLQRAFRDLIRAIATPVHPLVVFLDDLQWTDGSTPQLLVRLLGEDDLRHVLFIGAFRDNEVNENHLLRHALSELAQRRPEAIRSVQLAPLSERSINQIVASTLRRDPAHTGALAALLSQKTAGNPFFLSELMNQLHREGAIRFDAAAGVWASNDEAIARAAFSDNVVELMVRRIRRLPPETIECLRLAACLGSEFELGLLAQVAKRTPEGAAAALWPAVEQRLLLPRGDDYQLLGVDPGRDGLELGGADIFYRFPHDRVQSAVYSLLGPDERARAHLEIGRLLRDRTPPGERHARIFDFIDHLNLGRSLLEGLPARAELAELDQAAGQRARRSAAYTAAVAYLEIGHQLLSPAEWATRRAREFEVLRTRAECVFLSGQVERAHALAEELFALAPDRAALASAYCLKAAILEQQSQLSESVATILRGLRELGLELPEDPALVGAGIGAGIGKMKAHLERVAIEDLVKLPSVTDPLQVATTELLFQLIPPASQMNPPLFILAELVLFDLALTHGTVPGSAKNFMDCGIVLGASLGDYAGAYRMGKAAFALLDRIVPTPLEAAVNFVFGCFISHWGAHFQEGLDALARSHQRGVELGDVLHASYAIIHRAKSMLFAGKDLAECQAQADRALAYTLETGSVGHVAVPRIIRRALGQLTAQNLDSDDLTLSDAEFASEIEKTGNGHFLLVLGQAQTLVHFVLGDLERAAHWDEFATRHIGVGNGAFPVPDHHLFQALLLSQRWAETPGERRPALLATIEGHAATLEGFARVCPANFAHKHKLACAELSRLRQGSIDEVLGLHREAQQAAGDDFLHLRAISYELQSAFWMEKGHPELARETLLEAYHLYRHWGATAKLRRLEREHSEWLRRAHAHAPGGTGTLGAGTLATLTAAVEGQNLDVASVIKATHAISSEVRPERLFSVLIQTIIENAGAQHGYLFVTSGTGALRLAARASVGDGEAPAHGSLLEQCHDVAREVVRYVARTQETLVLDDASADNTHGQDPHVVEAGVRSLLCMPVIEQGRLLAVLYAENNAVSRAFTPSRLILLRVIAGQAAISISNAELYANLEQKVAERTRELAERNREVAAMLESLPQGVFTIDEELRIQPRYSKHLEQLLEAPALAGRDCLELLFRGSDVGAERLENMRAALEFSFGAPSVFAEPNKAHWVREFQRNDARHGPRSFEVDWTLIAGGDDTVSKILVAVRDVTLMKRLRASAMKHARELDIVGQILDVGIDQFQRFCASARAVLAESEGVLAGPAASHPDGDGVFRGLHTIKGNARLLGLGHLSSAVHGAEEHLDQRQRALEPALYRRSALRAIEIVQNALSEYEQVCQRKLGDVLRPGRAWNDGVDGGIAAQIAQVKAGSVSAAEAVAAIDALLQRAGAVPLEHVVKSSARLLPVVALELGKRAPSLELTDPGPWLSAAWARVLSDALIHVFQNALDHGIEAPDERRLRGKPEQGKITLAVQRTPRGATLRVADDGRGLGLDALRVQAGVANEPDETTAERIFRAGITTAQQVTPVSGRGMGLDAVRALVRGVGGDLGVTFTGPSQAGFRPFELVFDLAIEPAPAGEASSTPERRSEPPKTRVTEAPPASK